VCTSARTPHVKTPAHDRKPARLLARKDRNDATAPGKKGHLEAELEVLLQGEHVSLAAARGNAALGGELRHLGARARQDGVAQAETRIGSYNAKVLARNRQASATVVLVGREAALLRLLHLPVAPTYHTHTQLAYALHSTTLIVSPLRIADTGSSLAGKNAFNKHPFAPAGVPLSKLRKQGKNREAMAGASQRQCRPGRREMREHTRWASGPDAACAAPVTARTPS
jgi:hypothetical protein